MGLWLRLRKNNKQIFLKRIHHILGKICITVCTFCLSHGGLRSRWSSFFRFLFFSFVSGVFSGLPSFHSIFLFLEVPHFASVFKFRKHFGLRFAYDAPMIWNDLSDEVRSANSLASFRSNLFEKHIHPNFPSFSCSFRGADPYSVSDL